MKRKLIKPINCIYFLLIIFLTIGKTFAIEPLNDSELGELTAQDGATILLNDFRFVHHSDQVSIGGDDGLGIPDAPDGAWFVFESTRIMELNLQDASFEIDVFTSGNTPYEINGKEAVPANTSAAQINFGEAFFHINMTDALLTLKFANNPQGNTGDGITQFSDTVCNFALDGSTITFKSEDARMFIYAH